MMQSNCANLNGQMSTVDGLQDALWACVLDDYLSDEDEEFSKIVNAPRNAYCVGISSPESFDDPRMKRGGDGASWEHAAVDGTPGIWHVGSKNELPPLMWLNLPIEGRSGDEINWKDRIWHREKKRRGDFSESTALRGRSRSIDSRTPKSRSKSLVSARYKKDAVTRSFRKQKSSESQGKSASFFPGNSFFGILKNQRSVNREASRSGHRAESRLNKRDRSLLSNRYGPFAGKRETREEISSFRDDDLSRRDDEGFLEKRIISLSSRSRPRESSDVEDRCSRESKTKIRMSQKLGTHNKFG